MDMDTTAREVLARIHAVRGLCDAMLAEKILPTQDNLEHAAQMLTTAAEYAHGWDPLQPRARHEYES